MSRRGDFAEELAGKLVEQLKAGTAPWVRPWKPGERSGPYNALTGKSYRGLNAVALMAEQTERGYGDPRWITYRQAQELGGQVKAGERSTLIQFWLWTERKPLTGPDGKPLKDERGRKGGPKHKLDSRKVREIRALLRDPEIQVSEVAERYGISRTTIYRRVGAVRPIRQPEPEV